MVATNASSEDKERSRTLTWEEVRDPNGAVLAYEVRLTPLGTNKVSKFFGRKSGKF